MHQLSFDTSTDDTSRAAAHDPSSSSGDGAAAIDMLVSRIEKLWRKANDSAATPAERELFETKALALMQRHRIDAEMLDVEHGDPIRELSYGRVDSRYAGVVCGLIHCIAASYGCKVWWTQHADHRDVVVFGFRRDTERVVHLGRMLVADAMAQASQLSGPTGGQSFARRRSFVMGYAEGVTIRLQAAAAMAREQAEAEHGERGRSAALVVVSRPQQVDGAFSARWKGKGMRTVSVAAASSEHAYR
ncbi:MAG TPA: DUF2786 domain-containing protein, partial [Ilumatobacteraceae bacterium]|nr:DUF2786 domain-containing protein [Ilumatobacteraceae bacterium]